MMRFPRPFLLVLCAALLPAAAARAGDPVPPPPAENVPDAKAKEAIEAFRRDFKSEDMDRRLDALKRLRHVVHPDVADVLLDLALQGKEAEVRAAAFRGLTFQKTSAKVLGPKVARFLAEAAEANRKAKAKGDYGFLVDRKTGEPDYDSPEGKAAMRVKRDRGKMLAEAARLLDSLGYREKDSVEAFREFLFDGDDDLVAMVLGMFGKWKEWSVLKPEFLELFEMYPKEDEVNVGSASVDTGASGNADAQAAKRKWMAKYGDPDRRRPRPKVVKALKQAILDITGEKFEDPKAFREYLSRPEVKRRVRAG
jgi:hypothetical protein